MSKQWGKAHIEGQKHAFRKAGEAVKAMQDQGVYAMALVNKLMLTHPDRQLVEEVHQALHVSGLSKQYSSGFFHGAGCGMFVEDLPPMSKKQGLEAVFSMAREHGWKG
jgi:hypothetical protein